MTAPALSPIQVGQLYNRLTGDTVRVIDYDKIINTTNFKNLVGDTAIVFYPALQQGNVTIGHYVAIIINEPQKLISFYDPLGYLPDGYKRFTNRALYRERSNTLIAHLIKYHSQGYTIDYNNHQHQSRSPDVSTCGWHCVVRCVLGDMTNDRYNAFWNAYHKKHFKDGSKLRDDDVMHFIRRLG